MNKVSDLVIKDFLCKQCHTRMNGQPVQGHTSVLYVCPNCGYYFVKAIENCLR